MHVKFKGQGLVLCVGNQIVLQEIVKNVTETQKKSPDLTCLLTILAGGDGAVLAVGVNLGECEEHHGPGVAAAGERSLSEAAHGHRRSLEVTGGRGRDDRAWETDTGHARTELQPGTTGPDWLDTDHTLQSPHFQNRGHHSHKNLVGL